MMAIATVAEMERWSGMAWKDLKSSEFLSGWTL